MLRAIIGTMAVAAQIIAVLAYIPQIRHLRKTKDSTGISLTSWVIWVLSNVILLVYALTIQEPVFIITEAVVVIANVTIVVLTYRYRQQGLQATPTKT